jgi:hypothetical protein
VPRRSLLAAPIALAVALAQAPAAVAAVNAWSAGSAEGGNVSVAALAGQRAFAGVRNGGTGGALLTSTDGGATWRRVTSFGYRDVTGVAIDPGVGQPVYASTFTGVFRSLDRGATWAEISGGTGNGKFFDGVAVDRGRPGTAFFERFSTAGGGVFRTATGGAGLWTDVSGGLGMIPLLDGIVVDPVTHWAWGWRDGAGVFVLTDGATTWSAANVGLPSTSVRSMAVDGPAARIVVATTSGAATLPSTGGPSWTTVNGGLTGSLSTYLLAASADASGAVYATSLSKQAWKLASGATTWTPVDGGLPGGFAGSIVGDPAVAGHALALTAATTFGPFDGQGPLWRTVDGGDTFTRASKGVDTVSARDVAAAPRTPRTALAATDYDGVQRSLDGGSTWHASGTGLPVGLVWAVAFDGVRANIAYASTINDGVYRSVDSGATWSHLATSPDHGYVIATDPARAGTIYAGSGKAIYASTNLGASFTPLPTTGLPSSFFVEALVADPDSPGSVYAAGDNAGVFRLAAGDTTWQSRSSGLTATFVGGIAFDPRSQATLAATSDGGVYRSANRGVTWAPATNGIGETPISSVVYDRQLANVAYAATSAGVYRTTNGGTTWKPLVGGLALPSVRRLRFDADGRTLYGATSAIGVVARTRAVAPTVRKAPTVTGTPRGGRLLRGHPGAFAGTPAPTLAFSWQRCNARGRACHAIPGAHRTTHRVVAADSGFRLRFVVTARNGAGALAAASKATARVRARPSVAARPKLIGTARVGRRLRVRFTVHALPVATVAVHWQRCTARGRACGDIAGATTARYVLVVADRRHRVRAVVALRNALGRTVVASAPSLVVR